MVVCEIVTKQKIKKPRRDSKMKKTVVASLAAAMVISAAGTSFAASNPFVDVPAKNWAYGAVTTLAQAGIVDGYADGKFMGDRTITRYEMAQIIAKAMAKEDKATAAQKATIDKLAAEYKTELEGLNVRVTNLETAVSKFSISGQVRTRLDKGNTGGPTVDQGVTTGNYTPNSHINFDGLWAYKVNDTWSIKGESEFGRNFNNANTLNTDSQYEQFYVTGPVAGATVKAGRFAAYSPSGLIYDDKVTGGQVVIGSTLKATFEGGRTNLTDGDTPFNTVTLAPAVINSLNYASAMLDYPLSANTNIHAGYYRIGANPGLNQAPGKAVTYYTGQIDSQLSTDWNFKVAYAKSNATGSPFMIGTNSYTSTETKQYLARVTYKTYDMSKPGSYDLFAMYRKSPQLSSADGNTDDWRVNSKGTRIGLDYSLDKNIGLTTWYTFGKDVDTNAKNNEYRAEVDFNF
jgi:hypothetical protein